MLDRKDLDKQPPIVAFEDGPVVYRLCPTCGKFLTTGKVFINGLDQVRLEGWICKTHGEVKPEYEFIDY